MISLRRSTIVVFLAWIAALLLTACGGGDEASKTSAPGTAPSGDLDTAMEKAMADVPSGQRSSVERGDEGEIRYSGKTDTGESFKAQLGGAVSVPEGFPDDMPLYPKGVPFSVMETGGGISMVTVNSEDSESSVYEYYKNKLPNAGWQIDSEVNVGGGRVVNASKGDSRAVVHIQKMDDGARVSIMVSPQS